MNIVCFTIHDSVLGDNKPIWMQAEEREENKVSLQFSWLNMNIHMLLTNFCFIMLLIEKFQTFVNQKFYFRGKVRKDLHCQSMVAGIKLPKWIGNGWKIKKKTKKQQQTKKTKVNKQKLKKHTKTPQH